MKACCYLLDSSNWTSYVTSEKANWAIGGPTIELLEASYNAINTSSQRQINTFNSYGYNFTDENGFYKDGVNANYLANNEMPWNHGTTYWFAAPSSNWENELITLQQTQGELTSAYYGNKKAFRPIVCLKEGATVMIAE